MAVAIGTRLEGLVVDLWMDDRDLGERAAVCVCVCTWVAVIANGRSLLPTAEQREAHQQGHEHAQEDREDNNVTT